MTSGAGRRGFAWFLVELCGLAVVVGAVGWIPTQRVAGGGGIAAMLAGLAVAVAASVIGAVPAAVSGRTAGRDALTVMGACMALRLIAAGVGGAALAMSGWLARGPLLIWLAIGYAALLAADTRYLLRRVGVKDAVRRAD